MSQLEITSELKDRIVDELLIQRRNFTGSDAAFAKIYGVNKSVFSQLASGKREGLLSASKWLNLARTFDISLSEKKLKFARTEVVDMIEEEVLFCKNHHKSMMFVDECEIGKTVAARYLHRKLENCFYVDASQCKTAILFIRTLAKAIGLENTGKISELKADIKYTLRYIPFPVVLIDEAGDLKHEAWMELKELWNGTEGSCGWYLLGAEGLRAVIEKGRANKRVGYAEMFSRFSSRYGHAVPYQHQERLTFYKRLVSDVLLVNGVAENQLNSLVTRCLTIDPETNQIGGLRRAESVLILNQ